MGAFSDVVKNKMLDAVTGRATYTAEAGCWIKLHTGSPGASGKSNPATHTTRVQAAFADAPSAGAISNTTAISFTSLSADETFTHVSMWSASSGGTFLGADDLPAPKAMNTGDTLTIPIGDLDLSISGTLP